MPSPLISVIIPCYNAEKYVKESIDSILRQTYSNLEIVIVDDCSSDNTLSILKGIAAKDNRVKLFCHAENKKLIHTLNECIDYCHGDFIARMDSDDISEPTRLQEQITFLLKNPNYDVCGTSAQLIDEDGKKLSKKKMITCRPIISEIAAMGNFIIHPSVMMRRSVLLNNKYDSSFPSAEDYELWCRLLCKQDIKMTNLPFVGLKYRISNNQISSAFSNEQVVISKKIILDYGLVDPKYISLHMAIFFGVSREKTNDSQDETYIRLLFKKIRKINFLCRFGYYRFIMSYLRKKNRRLFYKCFFINPDLFFLLFKRY